MRLRGQCIHGVLRSPYKRSGPSWLHPPAATSEMPCRARRGTCVPQPAKDLRRTVATLLENAGVPEDITADILRHEKKTLSYGLYSSGSSMDRKIEAIEKLVYPGASL